MAMTSQTTREGQEVAGLFTSGQIPERLIKRGITNLGKMSFITRGMTSFSSMLHTRFPAGKTVDTREHKVYEITELDRTFMCTVASTDPGAPNNAHDIFGMTNAQAAQLQANDIIYRINGFVFVQSTAMQMGQVIPGTPVTLPANSPNPLDPGMGGDPTGIVFSNNFGIDAQGNVFVDYEQMLILSISAPNSAGLGHTNVRVQRCFKGPGGADYGGRMVPLGLVNTGIRANAAAATINVGDIMLRGGSAWREGTNAPTGLTKNPVIDNNFTQEFKYAVEMTKESEIEALWSDKKPLDINRMLLRKRMTMDVERKFLFGQKGKSLDAQGRVLYTMGGVVEFIKKDPQHIIVNTQGLSYPALLNLGPSIFGLGGSAERDVYVGYTLHSRLKQQFYNSGFMRTNPEMSKNFRLQIDTIETTGGILNIIPCFSMEEAGWGTRGIALDPGYPSFIPVTHEGWDMKIEKDIQEKGAQVYKEQVVGIKGLERRYSQYHSIIQF
jgi:hypothetical protein